MEGINAAIVETGAISVSRLRSVVDGAVIGSGDATYDQARTVFYGGIDLRPAAIVRAAHARDVAAVVRFARETGSPLAVRSGGHSPAGHGVCEGGIVLDMGAMRAIGIDGSSRMAWTEPGLTAGEYVLETSRVGLTTGFGDTGSVGIGGITLAGGVGYLVRRYGLAIDNLLAADVVTADGTLLHVDARDHPDLFWALRGGGGNFGVVTRLWFRLEELDGIFGGMLLLPATAEVIANFVAEAEAAPEEVSAIANIMPAPPLPFVPAEHHGRLVLMASMVSAGSGEGGERVAARLRSLGQPIADLLRPMRYVEMFPRDEGGYHPMAVSRTMFVDRIGVEDARKIVDRLRASDAALRVAQLRVLGGAMARVAIDATAFAHRRSRIMVNLAAFYDGVEERVVRQAWLEEFAGAIRQQDSGAYVGFLGDEGAQRIRDAYPGPTGERLARVKARYDPGNLFRINQNIEPSASAG